MKQRASSLRRSVNKPLTRLTKKKSRQITSIRNAMVYNYKPYIHQKDNENTTKNPIHINLT